MENGNFTFVIYICKATTKGGDPAGRAQDGTGARTPKRTGGNAKRGRQSPRPPKRKGARPPPERSAPRRGAPLGGRFTIYNKVIDTRRPSTLVRFSPVLVVYSLVRHTILAT